MAECLVLGIGNPDRGDDAVGRLIARTLRTRVPACVRVAELDGEAMALLSELQSARCVWLIDAARSGAPSGTINRIDCSITDLALPPGTVSSHGFGVVEAIALARALDVLPPECVIYAVETTDFTAGEPLSREVSQAADQVAARILEEIQAAVIPRPPSPRRRLHRAPATDRR